MTRLMMILGALLLAACGTEQSEEEKPKGGVIGEAYVESLEEAEAVEDLAKERADRLQEEIDGADQAD